MAEALERWMREEMELPPSAIPSPAVLRRLCTGSTAPIWEFVTRHVRNERTVKKIRGNLRWYGYLQEMEAAPGPPSRQGALRAEVERLRKELQLLEDAIEGAQEEARRLEASLGAGQRRRWAELQRGAELRLLGAEPSPDWLRGDHQGALKEPLERAGPSRAELSATLASGMEPEVLVSIKSLCQAKEEELQRPRPPGDAQEEARDWLEQAQAVLVSHSPGALLWALQELANQSTRVLLASPAPSPQAPPTLRSLLQGCWGAVGGVWARLPPLLSHLAGLRRRLQELRPQLGQEESASLAVTRAGLQGFWGSLSRELQRLREPQKPPKFTQKPPKSTQKMDPKFTQKIPEFTQKMDPKSTKFDPKFNPNLSEFDPKFDSKLIPKIPKFPEFDPKFNTKTAPNLTEFDPKLNPKLAPKIPKSSEFDPKIPKFPEFDPKMAPNIPKSAEFAPKIPKFLEFAPNFDASRAMRRLQRRRQRALRLRQRLRFLSAATRGRRAALGALQEQVVGVARAGPGSAPPLLEGEGRRRRGLALGALGEPLPHPGTPPPLWEARRQLGGQQRALLSRAAILKQQLRQGALSVRRGAWPWPPGAWPEPEVPAFPPELLSRLRLVSTGCRERIRGWPRLQGLVDQWWSLPAQWTQATPPGHAPFSHWLQRWRSAALALQATPTLLVATPSLEEGEEGEGQGKKAPPPTRLWRL